MKRFAHLLAVLPILYCVQVPSVDAVKSLVTDIATVPFVQTHVSHEVAIPNGDGSFDFYFTSSINEDAVRIFLLSYAPTASFCN